MHGCDLPEGECATDDELIDQAVAFVQVHAYPDLLTVGVESPILYKMEFSRFVNILPDLEITENAYFMENSMSFFDNYVDVLEIDSQERTFFEEEKTERVYKRFKSNTKSAEKEYARIFFRASQNTKFYKRVLYSLLDYLGDLGGLKEIIFFFGALIT